MQMRLIPALILFLGSYFPLSLILLSQDIKESSWKAPLCRLSAEYSCFLPELTNPWRAVGLLLICAASLVPFKGWHGHAAAHQCCQRHGLSCVRWGFAALPQ